MAAGVALAFIGEMARYTQPGRSTGSIALSVLAISYAGLLMSFLVSLRLVGDPHVGHGGGRVADRDCQTVRHRRLFHGARVGTTSNGPGAEPQEDDRRSRRGWSRPPVWVPGCATAWIVPRLVGPDEPRGSLPGWLCYGLVLAVAGMLGDLGGIAPETGCAGERTPAAGCRDWGAFSISWTRILFAAAPAYVCWVAGLIGPIPVPMMEGWVDLGKWF